jgi:hypothetical protein
VNIRRHPREVVASVAAAVEVVNIKADEVDPSSAASEPIRRQASSNPGLRAAVPIRLTDPASSAAAAASGGGHGDCGRCGRPAMLLH